MRSIRLLALVLVLGLFPLAGVAETGARPVLNVYFMPAGAELNDLPQINQRLNELLRERFDYDVHLVLPRASGYHQAIQAELTLGKDVP